MESLDHFIATTGDLLWTWLALPVVALLGLYFTLRSGVLQLRLIPEMFRTLTDRTPRDADGEPQSVSAFGAFTISAASRVGMGNVAGVSTAIALGGAGAVFWMWLMAFFGAASAFIESTLAQLYKRRGKDGFHGGPAYYMQHGLNARWMGILFAVTLIICFPFAFSSAQANTISATVTSSIGSGSAGSLAWAIGLTLAVLTGLVIFGGVRRIATVAQAVVPAMASLYLVVGLVIVALNADQVPAALTQIFTQAFGYNEVLGAGVGAVVLQGIKRGMFSNEAGLGSAPNAGATAAVTHPVKQGLVQSLGVYFDTMVICTVTALIILVSTPDLAGAEVGIGLTQAAFDTNLGAWSNGLLSLVVFLLAFSSILGNYYYGEANLEFITGSGSGAVMQGYRILVILAILGGAVATADLVWTFADTAMGLMALVNLVAIALLSGVVWRLLDDYLAQRKQGQDPVFTRERLPDVDGLECWEDAVTVSGSFPAVRD